VSSAAAWQLWWVAGAFLCVLAGAWFLLLTAADEGRRLGWALALGFGVLCVAAAANLRRLLWEAFAGPWRAPYYVSAMVEAGLWALISAGLAAACARAGAARAARGWAVAFVAFSALSAYCFWRVL
jgi:hypothetical protein